MPEHPVILTFQGIKVGDRAVFQCAVSEQAREAFAQVSGDFNSLHVDPAYAADTQFNKPLVHGMLVGSYFSRLVGMYLPGKYSLYLSQTLSFHRPVYVGLTLRIQGAVVQKIDALQVVKMRLEARAENNGTLLVSGEAIVKVLR